MRVASDVGDVGFANFLAGREEGCFFRVTVDGVEIIAADVADEEAGYVIAAVQPYEVNEDHSIKKYTVHGEVVITKFKEEK